MFMRSPRLYTTSYKLPIVRFAIFLIILVLTVFRDIYLPDNSFIENVFQYLGIVIIGISIWNIVKSVIDFGEIRRFRQQNEVEYPDSKCVPYSRKELLEIVRANHQMNQTMILMVKINGLNHKVGTAEIHISAGRAGATLLRKGFIINSWATKDYVVFAKQLSRLAMNRPILVYRINDISPLDLPKDNEVEE